MKLHTRQFSYHPSSMDGEGATSRNHTEKPKRRWLTGWDGKLVDTSDPSCPSIPDPVESGWERWKRELAQARERLGGIDVVPYNPINTSHEQRKLYVLRGQMANKLIVGMEELKNPSRSIPVVPYQGISIKIGRRETRPHWNHRTGVPLR